MVLSMTTYMWNASILPWNSAYCGWNKWQKVLLAEQLRFPIASQVLLPHKWRHRWGKAMPFISVYVWLQKYCFKQSLAKAFTGFILNWMSIKTYLYLIRVQDTIISASYFLLSVYCPTSFKVTQWCDIYIDELIVGWTMHQVLSIQWKHSLMLKSIYSRMVS